MPLVLVGFGDYLGYRVPALPNSLLSALAERYPLLLKEEGTPEYNHALITISIHAELQRRAGGGRQERHVHSLRDLAKSIVGKGFQQASKRHHPDTDGDHETQVRVAKARDLLLDACEGLADDYPQNVIFIPAPPAPGSAHVPPVDDDDVPF